MRQVRGEGEQFPAGDASCVDPQEPPRRLGQAPGTGRLLRPAVLAVLSWERDNDRFLPLLLLAVVMTAAAMLLLYLTRGESLFADEWGFFVYRGHGWTDTLFAPNNGSLILVPLLVYRTVFKLFGPSITVLRLVLVVLELVCAALFFELTRRRVASGWRSAALRCAFPRRGLAAGHHGGDRPQRPRLDRRRHAQTCTADRQGPGDEHGTCPLHPLPGRRRTRRGRRGCAQARSSTRDRRAARLPYCLGPWISATLVGALLVVPRATSWITSVLSIVSMADLLQIAYKKAEDSL